MRVLRAAIGGLALVAGFAGDVRAAVSGTMRAQSVPEPPVSPGREHGIVLPHHRDALMFRFIELEWKMTYLRDKILKALKADQAGQLTAEERGRIREDLQELLRMDAEFELLGEWIDIGGGIISLEDRPETAG